MSASVALLIMGAVALVVAVGGLAASAVLSPNKFSRTKVATYECGIDPMAFQASQGRFPIKYYLVAMSFIVFDVEVVFLYPWAVSIAEFGAVAQIALFGMLTFVELLAVPFLYEWARGGFDY
ncbi:NADH-quinone oxidoreductase subunit A [Nanchangia anserum]|uniref:NADH-quinone oxidoreductase subunit n=1 Tax=Nanchangia anserum TaxID=2692125 RepID=A0A8I0GBX0_9ACTO|nr:NADH-quinone oxidoreductase subunit A [Nanchangia anserum]MBD3689335.1 NADH-quinone oxidoreductase subunit A [Nanchangia anserum]QOX81543.1 NADH-quinone oxidoreductase subunit A [Nanchangia anserum]